MSDSSEVLLHELAARAAIPDLIFRYTLAVSERNLDLYTSCFSPDAELEFSFAKLKGLHEIVEHFTKSGQSSGLKAAGIDLDETLSGTPTVGNILITVDGDTAHSESTAVAWRHGLHGGQKVTTIRGMRYSDDFILLGEGWKISRRIHETKWGTEIKE